MTYVPVNYQNAPSTATPVASSNLNADEMQYTEAINSLHADLHTPFIASGLAISGATGQKVVTVPLGVIYLLSTQDSTLRRFATTATTFTCAVASTTYYLDIYPVASTLGVAPTYGWSFATSHTAHSNYYTVATITTDGSSNITAVINQSTTGGVHSAAMPTVGGLTVGGMLALVYAMPSAGPDDIPGKFLGAQIVGPIDWTNYSLGGQTAQYYMRIIGMIKPTYSQTYTFYVTSNDAVRLYVGDQEIVGNSAWINQSATTYSGTISLVGGQWYPVIIEHTNAASGESLKFEWQSSSQTRQDVPASAMGWQFPQDHGTVVVRHGYFHYDAHIAGNIVWHAGNDGVGSGLDADKLDGRNYTVSPTAPSSPAKYDVWIHTPFS